MCCFINAAFILIVALKTTFTYIEKGFLKLMFSLLHQGAQSSGCRLKFIILTITSYCPINLNSSNACLVLCLVYFINLLVAFLPIVFIILPNHSAHALITSHRFITTQDENASHSLQEDSWKGVIFPYLISHDLEWIIYRIIKTHWIIKCTIMLIHE